MKQDSATTTEFVEPVRANRFVRAAIYYFALVLAVGLILGPARVLWLEPWLGATFAVLLETPFLIAAMWFGARLAPRWAGMTGGWAAHLGVGALALALQQVADLAVGFGLRGMTLADQLAYFSTPPGLIYAASLVMFAAMPLVRFLARRPG